MLPAELVFNYPSIEALAGFLLDGLEADEAPGLVTRSPAGRRAALQSEVLQIVASVLGQEVTSDEPLVNAGMDSISANELRSQLARAVGLAMLPPEIVFDYPTVDALVTYLEEYVDDTPAPPTAVAPQPGSVRTGPVHGFDAFARSLKEMLSEALVLEGEWPEFYDDVALGELGVSIDILRLVHDHFRVDVQMNEEDTLTEILRRARILLPE
jgi:acyl carrier protein